MDSKFWNNIYQKKNENEVSWFQEKPAKSLEFIDSFQLPLDAKIIDIGGGDSRLVDHLLERGFTNLSVLDISFSALEKQKNRLGDKALNINYHETDILNFKPTMQYQLWHDRAAFHFLTTLDQVEKYLEIAYEAVAVDGYLIISTFSKTGPEKCSGLPIAQYSEEELKNLFGKYFKCIKCFNDGHITPWASEQNFVYCSFKKII